MAPVHRAPTEILSKIFELVLFSYSRSTLRNRKAASASRTAFSRVSHEWHDTVHLTPALWSLITISSYGGHQQQMLNTVFRHLDRCGILPLDVAIHVHVPLNKPRQRDPLGEPFICAIRNLLPRVEAFTLHLTGYSPIWGILPLNFGKDPQLYMLDVKLNFRPVYRRAVGDAIASDQNEAGNDVDGSDLVRQMHTGPPIDLLHADSPCSPSIFRVQTNISSLSLDHVFGKDLVKFSFSVPRYGFTWSACCKLLASTTILRNLEMRNVQEYLAPSWYPHDSPGGIYAPSTVEILHIHNNLVTSHGVKFTDSVRHLILQPMSPLEQKEQSPAWVIHLRSAPFLLFPTELSPNLLSLTFIDYVPTFPVIERFLSTQMFIEVIQIPAVHRDTNAIFHGLCLFVPRTNAARENEDEHRFENEQVPPPEAVAEFVPLHYPQLKLVRIVSVPGRHYALPIKLLRILFEQRSDICVEWVFPPEVRLPGSSTRASIVEKLNGRVRIIEMDE